MAKLTLSNLDNLLFPSTATINSNNDSIELAMENTLSRNGHSPNQMDADLDMNSSRILNLPAPGSANEPLRLQELMDFLGTGEIEIETYTDEDAQDAVGSILSDIGDIDFTYDDTTPAISASIKSGVVGATELDATGVVAGTYSSATITVDANGRISEAATGGGEISVLDYGAVGDYNPDTQVGTDNTAAFQAAIDDAVLNGKSVFIPEGRYKISGNGVVADLSALDEFHDHKFSIRGSGRGVTFIYGETNDGTAAIAVIGANFGTGGHYARWKLSGFTLSCRTLASPVRTGIFVDRCIFGIMEDIEINECSFALSMVDVVGIVFTGCQFSFNNRGIFCSGAYTSSPVNELTFVGCHWIANREYAFQNTEGGNIVFLGGSFENNGELGVSGERFAIRMANAGKHAVSALACYGTHFEGQAGIADIWIEHGTWPTMYTIDGCDFFRTRAASWPTNNIFLNNFGSAAGTITLKGCGFLGVNDYVADVSRKVFAETGASTHDWVVIGCQGITGVDAPVVQKKLNSVPNTTGWSAATGTATRSTFATGSVTTAQLAERVKALIDDLTAQKVIGA